MIIVLTFGRDKRFSDKNGLINLSLITPWPEWTHVAGQSDVGKPVDREIDQFIQLTNMSD